MATCKPCSEGDHDKCVEDNEDKTTSCPGCCQHRQTTQVVHAGEIYTAPEGVTGIDVR